MTEKEITIQEVNPEGCQCKLEDFHDPCYKQVLIGTTVYDINDFVLVKPVKRKDFVARLVCIFINEKLLFQAIVKKFVFAKNLKKQFLNQQYQYAENEVVQELGFHKINLAHISKKCTLVLLSENDDPFYLEKNVYDLDSHFSCRFFLKSNQLIYLKEMILPRNETYNKAYRDGVVTPSRKVSVKRNLNSSFSDADYSIMESDQKESLKIVLKKSTKSSANSVTGTPSTRKSTRNITRKSYADFVSPKKFINDECESPGTPKRSARGREMRCPVRYNAEEFNKNNVPSPSRDSKPIIIHDSINEHDTTLPLKKNDSSTSHSTRTKPIVIHNSSSEDSDCHQSKKSNRKRTAKKNKNQPLGRESDSSDDGENIERETLQLTPKKRSKLKVEDCEILSPSESLNSSQEARFLKVHLENLSLDDSPREKYQKTKSQVKLKEINTLPAPLTNIRTTPKPIQRSTPRRAPTRRRLVNLTSDESDTMDEVPRTPSKRASKKLISSCKTPKTPRSKLKLIKEGIITPSMQSRCSAVKKDDTPLMKARSQLHVSHIPESLPCREKEYQNVYRFLEGKLSDKCGGCMYISGVPGTGKTATVTSVIANLKGRKGLPEFTFIDVNAMKLSEPRQVYVEILKQLTGKMIPWERALRQLESIFVNPKSHGEPVVILIDELDILCTKRQEIIYNLLDWPAKANNQLIIITIANAMDLPERLLKSRITSRLGLTRLTFQAYTFKQLEDIVMKRVQKTNSFNPEAVQFVARRVASASGDARRALDICRRAAEIAENENDFQLVTIEHVNEAINSMLTQPKVQAIKHCSKLEQILLQAMVAEVERTGVEETTFPDVYRMFLSLSAIERFPAVPTSIALEALFRLNSSRLILMDVKNNDIHQRLILNVRADDIYYALKEEE